MKRSILITYAFVSRALAKEQDFFMALVPLLRPVMEKMANQVFDPREFCDLLAQYYGLSCTTDVAQEFVPRLVKAGFLTTQAENLSRGTYLCIVPQKTEAEKTNEPAAETIITTAVAEFRKYIENFPTLLTIALTDDELVDLLVDWLINSEAALRHAQAALAGDLVHENDSSFKSEGEYLCARFVGDLRKSNAGLFDDLALISTGALISEVILDLRSPPDASLRVKDLTVFLDAPFMMDVLDLTGQERKENSKYIFQKLSTLGARLQIFTHSIEEIVDNLRGVLRQPIYSRTGPTGDAIRKLETSEDYVRTVLADVRSFVEQKGVTLLDERIATIPGEIPYFDGEMARQFDSSLQNWKVNIARERDTKSVAFVMRRRRGHASSDFFQSRVVLLTHNPALARIAQRFCVEEGLIRAQDVGPVVQQRRVAALLWLTVGSDERLALSRRQLVANCANAVRTKQIVIQSMRRVLNDVRPEWSDQLDALLTRPRSVQLAMDLTLGTIEVLGPDRIEEIFELIKSSAAEKEKEAFQSDLKRAKEKMNATLDKKDIELAKIGEEVVRLETVLLDHTSEDRTMFEAWVRQSHQFARRIIKVCRVASSVLVIASAVLGSNLLNFSLYPTLISVLIAIVVAVLPVWMDLGRLEEVMQERLCNWRLRRFVTSARRDSLSQYADVTWSNPPRVDWHGVYARS